METDDILKTVSENMVWRRDQLGLKLWEISAATGGMDMGHLSRLINGHREFYPSTLVKLSRAFGVEFTDWFLPHDRFVKKYAKRTKRVEIVVKGPSNSQAA